MVMETSGWMSSEVGNEMRDFTVKGIAFSSTRIQEAKLESSSLAAYFFMFVAISWKAAELTFWDR